MLHATKSLSRIGVVLLLLLSGTAYPQSQAPSSTEVEALREQLEHLRQEMSEVQARLDQLSPPPSTAGAPSPATGNQSAQQTTGGQTAEQQASKEQSKEQIAGELNQNAKHPISDQVAQYQTFSQDSLAAPRVDNAPLDPRYPGYFRLPGTQTLLKIGGYFKTDFIRDFRPAGDPDRFIPASIPIPPSGNGTNSTVSIRPTRLNLDFLIPTESADNVRFFVEADLFGTNATTPRLRHAYAQAKNFLIGQTFSNFQDPDAGPDQLDFQGPNAQINLRNPQFRYTIPISKKTSFRLALEKASSDIAFTTPQFTAQPSNQAPDGTATLRHEMDRGHVQFSGLFRSVGAFLPNGLRDYTFAWGLNLTGSMRIIGKDTLVYQGVYGRGIERYVQDTSGLGIDAGVENAAAPHLKAVPVVAPYGGYQHFWTGKLRSSVIYGFVQVDNTDLQPGSTFHQSNYFAGNLIYNPFGSLIVGTEFLYGWLVEKNGAKGNAPRLMVSAKYNFVKSEAQKK